VSQIVYGLSVIMLLVVCLVSSPLAGDLYIFLFCIEFPDYPDPLSFFVFISPVTIFVLCSLSIVVKIQKKIVAYRFSFDFLASPADELWH